MSIYISGSPTPTISIVIPNRNDSAYLGACLESVINQEILPDEVIFVDDQSSDESVSVARSYLDRLPRAKILVNEICLGTMGALNVGLKHVTSDYVLFLASNDHLENGLLARVKSSLASSEFPGVWSAMVWAADVDGTRTHIYPSAVISTKEKYFAPVECLRLANSVASWFMGTTLFYHSETLQRIGGFDVEYGGLADMFAALELAGLKGAIYCPQPFGVMRVHSGGFLWRTLTDHAGLENILNGLEAKGKKICPELFTQKFSNKTRHRIRFAALRADKNGTWPDTGGAWSQGRYGWLGRLWRVLPQGKVKVALTFLLVRPFDLLPMIWYRVIKVMWIRLRYPIIKY